MFGAIEKTNKIAVLTFAGVRRRSGLCVKQGDPVSPSSILFRAPTQTDQPTEITEAKSEFWLESEWGKRLPTLYEQVFFQKGGFALLMHWAEVEEEEEKDDDRTAKQRYRDQQQKWAR